MNETDMPGPTKDPYRTKWRVLTAGFSAYTFDAMDFMFLAITIPLLITEFDLTVGQAGLLGTGTLVGVGLSCIIMGWFADNYGRKRALMVGVAIFGIFTGVTGLAESYEAILILRFLAGIGLGGIWGVIAAFINETWPPHQRGRAAAFVFSSWPIGYGLAALLAAVVLPAAGWRALFFCGFAALAVVVYIYFFVPESEEWQREKTIRDASEGREPSARVRDLFKGSLLAPTLLGTSAATFALIGYWGVNTWIPTYLMTERGFDVGMMPWFIVIMNVGMFTGYQLFGYLADRIGGRNSLILTFAGAAVLVPLYANAEGLLALFLLGPIMAVFFSYSGIFGSYFANLYPAHIRSLGAGFCFDIGRGLSAVSPFALGIIAERNSLSFSIALCGISFAIAGLICFAMPRVSSETAVGVSVGFTHQTTGKP